jgi:hypothetical protein
MLDPYDVLGVARSAEQEVIQGAYRALSRKWHPDVNPSGEDRMKEITWAYAVLSDPLRRGDWDRQHPAPAAQGRPSRGTRPPPPPRSAPTTSAPPGPTRRCPGCGVGAHTYQGKRLWRLGRERCPDCGAGRAEWTLGVFFVPWLLLAGLLQHFAGGFAVGLVVAYPVAGLPAGVRLWRRLAATRPVTWAGRLIDGTGRDYAWPWLPAWTLRPVLVLCLGVVATPLEVVLAVLILVLEVRQGGTGDRWWRRQQAGLQTRVDAALRRWLP